MVKNKPNRPLSRLINHFNKDAPPSDTQHLTISLTVAAAILSPFRKLLAQTPTPQEKKSTETKVMGMGSHLLQGKHPIDQIDAYVCGLHFYNGEMGRQVIAHHFCSHRSEEFLQCVIYDT